MVTEREEPVRMMECERRFTKGDMLGPFCRTRFGLVVGCRYQPIKAETILMLG